MELLLILASLIFDYNYFVNLSPFLKIYTSRFTFSLPILNLSFEFHFILPIILDEWIQNKPIQILFIKWLRKIIYRKSDNEEHSYILL